LGLFDLVAVTAPFSPHHTYSLCLSLVRCCPPASAAAKNQDLTTAVCLQLSFLGCQSVGARFGEVLFALIGCAFCPLGIGHAPLRALNAVLALPAGAPVVLFPFFFSFPFADRVSLVRRRPLSPVSNPLATSTPHASLPPLLGPLARPRALLGPRVWSLCFFPRDRL